MTLGGMWKALLLPIVAAGGVWLVTAATFDPLITATVRPDGEVVYEDHRWFCSGGATIPYALDGALVQPAMPPRCRGGPIHADMLAPSPVPAIATFLLVGGGLVYLRLFVLGATTPVESTRNEY